MEVSCGEDKEGGDGEIGERVQGGGGGVSEGDDDESNEFGIDGGAESEVGLSCEADIKQWRTLRILVVIRV